MHWESARSSCPWRVIGGALSIRAALLCLALLSVTPELQAQHAAGEIHLAVTDPSGAAMEASGRIENVGGGLARQFRTDQHGVYRWIGLPSGQYRLEVSRRGFAAQSVLIDLPPGASISRIFTLQVAATTERVEVAATTPLRGVELPILEIPAPVQTATAGDIDRSGAANIADFLNRRFQGVYVNEIQGNPFQPDVNYRGYTASPLLGTPQGLSIYMDGMRLNQPFGDVVSWDLIPRNVISEVSLMPGSNPVFGLNTLGGALSIQTKDGLLNPGTAIQLGGGSFGRKTAELEHGGSNSKGFNWFLAGDLFFEDGWRADSPSNVRQIFGKLGWHSSNTSLGLSIAYANNSLTGNGLQEQRFFDRDYRSVYTIPDVTANRSPLLLLNGRHNFSSALSVAGNAYYRYIRTATLNGDINEASLDQAVYQLSAADIRALTAAGYTGFPTTGANASNTPFPFWRCIAQSLQKDEPGKKCNGLLNRTHSQQHNYGMSAQAIVSGSPKGKRNQLTVGAAYDGSTVGFNQLSQLGYLNPDRTVTGVNAYADGVTGGNVDGEPFDTRVDLRGVINTGSVFATDTLSGAHWSLTMSGRYNHTGINNRDLIQPESGSGSLTAASSYGRFNPAVGFTYSPARALNTYFGYSEGSRAPTSIELGCADPNQPCKLPNALAGDPPLKQVITRTVEAGLRGGSERLINWTVGWFWSESYNDILFVASTQTGFGYFRNFGETRRQGIQADVRGSISRLSYGAGYTLLDATYRSQETLNGSGNSTNDAALSGAPGMEGTIQITPGDQIPLSPRHMVKAFASLHATQKLAINLDFVATSSSYARGNENNLSQSDGKYYLGPGTSPGYGVVSLGARYQVHPKVQFFAQINNLFDRRYYTGAQLGPTGFTDSGAYIARPLPAENGGFPLVNATFYAPGAPFGAWGGIRIRF